MEKKINTSWKFPLIEYTVRVKYAEVRKASGIEYMLLVLIKESQNRNVKMASQLISFGIPQELHTIYAEEIKKMINLGIIACNSSYNIDYFDEYCIGHFSFTDKGNKLFVDLAIPTGEDAYKNLTVYYDVAQDKYLLNNKEKCYPIGESFLGEYFMDNIAVDSTSIPDFLEEQWGDYGFSEQERFVSSEIESVKNFAMNKEAIMDIIIQEDNLEFKFNDIKYQEFFIGRFSKELIEKGLKEKNKFKFIDSTKQVFNSTNEIAYNLSLKSLYYPEEYSTLFSSTAIAYLNNLDTAMTSKGCNQILQSSEFVSQEIRGKYLNNVGFVKIDTNTIKKYLPVSILFNNEIFGDVAINFVAESESLEQERIEIVQDIYNNITLKKATIDNFAKIVALSKVVGGSESIQTYISEMLNGFGDDYQKADFLSELYNRYKNNNDIMQIITVFADRLGFSILENTNANNVIENANILKKFDGAMSGNIVLSKRLNDILTDVDVQLKYALLDSCGFTKNELLPLTGVVGSFMQDIFNKKQIAQSSDLAQGFATLQVNFNALNNMLGINSLIDYEVKEDYDIEAFFARYSNFTNAIDNISKYKVYMEKEFLCLQKYTKLYEPIFDLLQQEKNISKDLSKINKSYVAQKINKGETRNAVCDMLIKLDYILKGKLNCPDNTDIFKKIDEAKRTKLITVSEADKLHTLRQVRNSYQHPSEKQFNVIKANLEEWLEIVFDLEDKK